MNQTKSAFTLLETMVAIIVILALVIGGSAMISHTGRGIAVQGHKRTAIEIASGLLEEEKAKAYSEITTPSVENLTRTVSGKGYPVTISRSKIGSHAGDELKTVSVVVVYYSGDSVSFQFSRAFE